MKVSEIICPHCKEKINYKKIKNKYDVDVYVWYWAFQSIYCPYCEKEIYLQEDFSVDEYTMKKYGGLKMKTFDEFMTLIKSIEEEYGVKISFSFKDEELERALKKYREEKKENQEEEEKEKPSKKKESKKEVEKEEKEEKKDRKLISENSLLEIEDAVYELFEEDENQAGEFYDHLCKEFGIESEEELYEDEKDEVLEMLKFLEDNPKAKITDAKRGSKKR